MDKKAQQKSIQQGEDLIFGNEATETRCPYCGTQTITEVIFTNGIMTYILAFIILLLFGVFFSMILIPLAFVFTKSLTHKCGACEQEIGTNGEIIFGSGIKDGVVSMKIGELGCILTKKIFITSILGIIGVLILWYRITHIVYTKSYGHSHKHDHITYTNVTWTEFKDDCGLDKISTHEKYHECENTYIDKTVQEWEGYIIRVEDYRQTLYQYLHHAVSILVKMNDSETDSHADVLLTFDSEMVDSYDETLNNLERGNQIGFNATMKSIGNHQQTRHMHVINIWKKDGYLNIPAHIHDGGRYDDTPRRMRGKADELPPAIKNAEKDENKQDQKLQEEQQKQQEEINKQKLKNSDENINNNNN